MALASGEVRTPERLKAGELIAFAPSENSVGFEAVTDTVLVLGSAAPHAHDLVTGRYSVHPSPEALRLGEDPIATVRERLSRGGFL